MRSLRLLLAAIGVGVVLVVTAPTAQAACHAFTVRAEPAQVAEGGKVRVTVTRDSGTSPSQIELSSVDVTAKGGEDYPAQKRTVVFTAETQQSFEIPITDDSASEGDETFRLHLSNPGGCAVNPNFQVGPDATVTIQRSDASATPPTAPPPTAAPTTSAQARTSTTSGSTNPPSVVTSVPAPVTETNPSTAVTTSSTAVTSATTGPDEADPALSVAGDEDDEGGSGGGGLVIAVVLATAALGGAGYFLYRRRSPGNS